MCCIYNTQKNRSFSLCLQFYKNANTKNSNVVRVAPRPKNPCAVAAVATNATAPTSATTTTIAAANNTSYSYNLANSFPATYSNSSTAIASSNYYPAHTSAAASGGCSTTATYPTFPINSINYTNYPTGQSNAQPPIPSLLHPPPPPPQLASGGGGGGILAKASAFNPFLARSRGCTKQSSMEKKFYSLKAIGIKKSPQFYSMRLNKCKRHHSFAAGAGTLQMQSTAAGSMPYASQKFKSLEQQPLYENLTDSIQIHESSSMQENVCGGGGGGIHLDERQCGEPSDERHSIYRSDSGISNSSYECVTPVPAPRTNPRKCSSAPPVYMNLPNMPKGSGRGGKSTNRHHGHHHHAKLSKGKSKIVVTGGAGAIHNYEVSCTQFE